MSKAPTTRPLAQVSARCGAPSALPEAGNRRPKGGRMPVDKPLAARNSGDFAYLKKPV